MSTAPCREDLRNLVDTIQDLPSFPNAIEKATSVAQDPRASAADLAEVIEVDPVLTAKVLRVTNSAFYGLSREISTVKEAVVILGFSSVRSLAIAVSTMRMFPGEDSPWFKHHQFWTHSTCAALVAHEIGRRLLLPAATEAFTAGLLHDIGKIVLDQYAHSAFMALLAVEQSEDRFSAETERRLIKTTHAEIGMRLAEKWKLPTPLCVSIGSHHNPASALQHTNFAVLCGLADEICVANGVPSVVNGRSPADLDGSMSMLSISPKIIADVNAQFFDILREAHRLIRGA
jgi:putative nucleotidyltransferase with HDIG domain